jgi:hypothetical protein
LLNSSIESRDNAFLSTSEAAPNRLGGMCARKDSCANISRWMNGEKMQEENLPSKSTVMQRIQKQPRKIIVLSCVDW